MSTFNLLFSLCGSVFTFDGSSSRSAVDQGELTKTSTLSNDDDQVSVYKDLKEDNRKKKSFQVVCFATLFH